jgi:ubiquinone/menaquinone biosynthesis C-methylase UbiE
LATDDPGDDRPTTPRLGLRRAAYYRLSPAWRRRARRIAFAPLDAWTRLRGGASYNGIPLPLRGEVFTGGGDFLQVGLRFLKLFRELGGLTHDDDVLDIGSGQGRMAIPLTGYLSPEATYTGFDIVPSAVEDCRRRISSRFPSFRFECLGVLNDLYTADGASAGAVVFPVDDDSIDFAFATSVFTHMEPAAIEHYLAEARRVVRPGGRALVTAFLMDEVALGSSAGSAFAFPHREADAWFMSLRTRSANVAIADDAWAAMVERTGWSIADLRRGSWSGRPGTTLEFQDVVVLA